MEISRIPWPIIPWWFFNPTMGDLGEVIVSNSMQMVGCRDPRGVFMKEASVCQPSCVGRLPSLQIQSSRQVPVLIWFLIVRICCPLFANWPKPRFRLGYPEYPLLRHLVEKGSRRHDIFLSMKPTLRHPSYEVTGN